MTEENKKLAVDYIFSQKKKGIPDEKIKNALLGSNWDEESVAIGFAEVEKIEQEKEEEPEKESEETQDKKTEQKISPEESVSVGETKKTLSKKEKDENIILVVVLVIIAFLILGAVIIFVDSLLRV